MIAKILALLTFFTFSAYAEDTTEPFKIQCVTSPPTTSLSIVSDGEEVTLRMYQHNGVKYMPIHRGIITSHDLKLLQERSDVLLKLPTLLELKTPAKDCKVFSDFKMRCFGRSGSEQGDVKVDSFYFYSHTVTTEVGGYNPFVATGVSLELTIDHKNYSIPMDYHEGDCQKTVN